MTVLSFLTGLLVLAGATVARPLPSRSVRPGVIPTGRARSPGRRRRAGIPDAVTTLPEVVDLLAVATHAGIPVGPAIAAVAPWAPEPWASSLSAAMAACVEGALLHDALDEVPGAVEGAGPLVAVLRAGLADGDSVPEGLARLAADARDQRRRRAQEQARRLPVRLLLPLVGCSLPAFVVLTIVPILAGALQGVRLPD